MTENTNYDAQDVGPLDTKEDNSSTKNAKRNGTGKRKATTTFSEFELLERGAASLQRAGILVFVVASLAFVLMLFWTSAFPDAVENWVRLRTIELFAMLAALGIIVSIISRSRNAFVLTFGILLIGALIVPTKDMVNLALLASGSSPTEQSRPQIGDGAEYKARDSDLGNKIIASLQDTPKETGDTDDPSATDPVLGELKPIYRQRALLAITETISRDRRIAQLERSRLNGSITLLLAFGSEGGFQEYYYRYGENDEFVEDLRSLRSHELVRFSYTDFTDVVITRLGKEVVCEYLRVLEGEARCSMFPEVSVERETIRQTLGQAADLIFPLSRTQELAQDLCERGEGFEELSTENRFEQRVETPKAVLFQILSEGNVTNVQNSFQNTVHLITTLRGSDNSGDPFITLLSVNDDGTCSILDSDDDGGPDVSSNLSTSLSAGRYLVVASDLFGRGSQMDFAVSLGVIED